jgi:small subunit ribosomal protein S21
MAKVKRKNNEYFDKFLNRFKKAVERDDVLRTYYAKTFYEKPTTKRKKAKELAIKRHQKQLQNEIKELKQIRLQAKT